MKIIRVFGVVVGLHLFALMLIFANPGCSSTSKPAPKPEDTAAPSAPPTPLVSVPLGGTGDYSSLSAAPVGFDPTAPAISGVRYSPTRPGTPVAGAIIAAPIADVTPATTYEVLKGDSLWTIAKKNKLTVSELAVANNLKTAAALRPGQKLIIPGKMPAVGAATPAKTPAPVAGNGAAPASTVKPNGETLSHTVKMGETLGTIARKYGVKQGEVAVANNVTDPQKIFAGQILVIPAGSKTTDGKAKPAPKAAEPQANPADSARAPFIVPPIEQDLDSGLKLTPATEVPVIKVEEALVPAPKK